ncbi:MAG: hypothetical protein ACNYPE_01910 [Candidatus Azotimanducaceae bacterium WSBS_2022_MAG_OTU7]
MTEPLYLVDASSYCFRAYFATPDTFVDGRRESVNAVYGYTNFMLDLLEKPPQYMSVGKHVRQRLTVIAQASIAQASIAQASPS